MIAEAKLKLAKGDKKGTFFVKAGWAAAAAATGCVCLFVC
jgi:hypothetical protein